MGVPLIQLQLGEYRERSMGLTAEDVAAALMAKPNAPPTRENLKTLSSAFEGAMDSALRVARLVRQGNVDGAFQELATARDKVEELAGQVTQLGGTFGKFDLRSLAQTLDWVDGLAAEAAARAAKSLSTDPATASGGTTAAPPPATTGTTDGSAAPAASSTDPQPATSALPSGGAGGSSVPAPTDANQSPAATVDLESSGSDGSGGGGGMALLSGGNQPPVAVNDSRTIMEDAVTTISVLENDSDPDGHHFFITGTSAPSHGKVTFTASTVTYRPDRNYNGSDWFEYTITDGHFDGQGQLGTATATVSITITPVDDYPLAGSDYAMTSQSSPVTINLLANDSDAEGSVSVVSVGQSQFLWAWVTDNGNGTATYDPRQGSPPEYWWPGTPGRDAFSYWITDSAAHQSMGTAYVYVTDDTLDDWPWAVDDPKIIDEDASVTIDVLGNDMDAESLPVLTSVYGLGESSVGTMEIIVNGQYPRGALHYTPPPDYYGGTYFGYGMTDSASQSDGAYASLLITAVNDDPVANPDTAEGWRGQEIAVPVIANDNDDADRLYGEPLTLILTYAEQPADCQVWFTESTVYFTAKEEFVDPSVTLSYTIADGHGGTADGTATVTVLIWDIDTDSDNDFVIQRSEHEESVENELDEPGKIMLVNDDDDNGNLVPDKNEVDGNGKPTVYTAADDDLTAAVLQFATPDYQRWDGYTLRLTCTSGLRLWEDQLRNEIDDDLVDNQGYRIFDWDITALTSSDPFPANIYVEGVSAGRELVTWELLDPDQMAVRSDAVVFTVVQAGMTIYNGGADLDNGENVGADGSAVSEASEESEGAYLLVNWDDDDTDGQMNADGSFAQLPVPDLTETSVSDEDNLAKLLPTLTPTLDQGIVEVEVTAGADKIKLWTQSTKGTEIAICAPKMWDLSDPGEKAEFEAVSQNGLWIEGISASDAERDVTIVFRYKLNGQEIRSDTVTATVVMINLGNAVYRDADLTWPVQNERGHAAIVARFDGPCTRPTLFADTHFMLIDQREGGPYYDQTLENITNLAGFPRRGCYTNPSVTYVDRLRILAAAKALIPRAPIAYGFDDAVGPVNWNGHLDTITALRCDSIVEVCYEINGINVWAMFRAAARGGDDTYNYSIADQADQWSYNDTTGTWTHQANQMPDNLEEHNDYDQLGDWDDTFMPATQAGYVAPENARTQFARQNLCVPIGSTGGN